MRCKVVICLSLTYLLMVIKIVFHYVFFLSFLNIYYDVFFCFPVYISVSLSIKTRAFPCITGKRVSDGW